MVRAAVGSVAALLSRAGTEPLRTVASSLLLSRRLARSASVSRCLD